MVRISNFIVFFSTYMILLFFTWYYLDEIDGIDRRVRKRWKNGIFCLCAGAVAILVVSQFTHFYYAFDENNCYYRNNGWWVSALIGVIGIVVDNILLFRYRRQTRPGACLSFMSYALLPMIAMVVQCFVYGYSFINFAVTLSVLVVFMTSKTEQARKLVLQERKLNDMRIAVMISQVKPHFLFNALTTIRYLCKTNPEEAVSAVDEFS